MKINGDLIARPTGNARLVSTRYRTNNIVQEVLDTERRSRDQVRKFAEQIPRSRAGLRMLYDFVLQTFEYREDPNSHQFVQSPARLYSTRVGDCKSWTIFISNTLHWMGVDRIIRFSAYKGRHLQHVYPVAIWEGEEVPMDVVLQVQEYKKFGDEKPYTHKKDFKLEGYKGKGLYALSGTNDMSSDEKIDAYLASLERAAADIPDVVADGPGDITKMTRGQFDRWLMDDRLMSYEKGARTVEARAKYQGLREVLRTDNTSTIAGIYGSDAVADLDRFIERTAADKAMMFELPTIITPGAAIGKFRLFKRNKKKVAARRAKRSARKAQREERKRTRKQERADGTRKGLFKRVGSAVKNAFTKIINWFWKGPAKLMAPYYLFQWIKKGVGSKKVQERRANQEKTLAWMQKIGKFDKQRLQEIMATGIKEQTGYMPAQIIDAKLAGAAIGALPLSALLPKIFSIASKAISIIVTIFGKLSSLFGKKPKNSPVDLVNEQNLSDLELLEAEEESKSKSGTSTGLALAASAGILVAITQFT